MRLVIDANILFAALIKDSSTTQLLINDNLQLFAPEFLFEEFAKYKDYILKKTHRAKENFKEFYNLLEQKITIISKDVIDPFLEQADEISPDPKDTVYLALCLAINSDFWSNDKKLKEKQDLVEILTTEEIINKVSSIKDEKDLDK